MSFKRTFLPLLLTFYFHIMCAGIFCPPTMYLHCDDDISDTDLTMMPTLLGEHSNYPARYLDEYHTNTCNVGYVIRTWFGDGNYNNQLDEFEPHCEQYIYLDYPDNEIYFYYPNDVTLSCDADIPAAHVEYISGPCDLIGVSHDDDTFELVGDACKKIIRHYTLINWCTYTPSDPGWNGEGIWHHDQIIKVIDRNAPKIDFCSDLRVSVGADCEAEVTLFNTASDTGSCPSNKLFWTAQIDLWADGTTDYTYGYLESGIFKIPPKENGGEITIKLPSKIGIGKHKVLWKVKDSCGNVTSCQSYFYTEDNKAPTPYCDYLINSAINGEDGWPLIVHASLFNRGATDNCTMQEDIKISFSENVNDTIRLITCANAGFQFFQIFATDDAGNHDFCEVYMVVFDNGSCNTRMNPQGRITDQFELPVAGAVVSLWDSMDILQESTSSDDGIISMHDVGFFEDYRFKLFKPEYDLNKIDLFDYFMLRDHLLGKIRLSGLNAVASDLDCNGKISSSDLNALKKVILDGAVSTLPVKWDFIAAPHVGQLDLQTLRNELWLKEFRGNLDFRAVQKGNLSNVVLESRSRAYKKCNLVEDVDREGIPFYRVMLEEDLDFDGMLVTHGLRVESDVIDLENGTRSSMSVKKGNISKGEEVMMIRSVVDLESIHFYQQSSQNVIQLQVRDAEPKGSEFLIAPNPARDMIRIIGVGQENLQICDLLGRPVLQLNNQDSKDIDISGLPAGIYVIWVDGQVKSRFIKAL